MVSKQRSRWQKIKQHRLVIGIVAFVVLIVIASIILVFVFGWDWTGFTGGESKITVTNTFKGTTTATELQPAKTLWDWLGLLAVLAIPVVAGIGATWFTAQLGKASDRRNSLEQMKNQKIVENQRQHAILQSYLDRMSELLLEKNLRLSPEDNEVRKVARAHTLATLLSLDAVHKGNLLQFLSESGLIDSNRSVIDLHHADLSSTNLHGAVLPSTDLVGTNLSRADLSDAYLSQANLNKADLTSANLFGANLQEANLKGANLTKAFLETASLFEADLQDANLQDANLELANLFEANLRGADLRRANLRNALVEDAELWDGARSLEGATMPDGSIHP
jgi:uncharacterized protein YjbI with pentapeptide repeats